MQFIDTHTHLYSKEFDEDRSEVVARAVEAGAKQLLLPNVSGESLGAVLQMCADYPEVCRPMMGLHPEDMPPQPALLLEEMRSMLFESPEKYCAVGEVGLDYYWDSSRAEEQQEVFRTQIEWSVVLQKPLSIHLRSAHADGMRLLAERKDELFGGVFHCFGGTAEEAKEMLDFPNFYLGIGGLVTFKKTTLPIVLRTTVPLERIVVETDAPYLTPTPFRGKRNESAYIPYIIEKLAAIYEVSAEVVGEITTANAIRLFGAGK